jgi:acyl-coenzyme A synthetase/AMP-(fatty) acid ligase
VEIDGILLSFPGVAEAVSFAVPDDMYGQEIHAAVVPAQGKHLHEKELQEFVGNKAAKFKVPKKVFPICGVDVDLYYQGNPEDGDGESATRKG